MRARRLTCGRPHPYNSGPHARGPVVMMSSRARSALALLALLAVVALVWTYQILPGTTQALANGDAYGYLYPAYETTYARLAHGILPLWNPYQLCGVPWLAALQTGVLYPPHALYLVLPTHTAMGALALGHLLLAAATTFAMARRVGIGPIGAALAGLLFAARGRLPWLVVVPNMFEAAAWLPLGCLGVLLLTDGEVRRGIVVLALATGMTLLAGYPQHTVFLLYAWGTLLAFCLVASRTPRRWLGWSAGFVAAIALGAALAAAQMLPTHELGAYSVRQTGALSVQQMYPIVGPWLVLKQLRDASIGGHPLSFGIVGLALLTIAPFVRARRTVVWWALAFGAATLGYAAGPATRFFEIAYRLPGIAWFRVPDRILFVTDFCFAIAAGAGLDTLATGGAGRLGSTISATTALVLAWLGVRQGVPDAPAYAAIVAAGAASTAVRSRTIHAAVAIALLALAATDVYRAPPRGLAMPYDADSAAFLDREHETYARLGTMLGPDRFWLIVSVPPPFDIGPKQPTRAHVRTIDDYEPFNLRRQAEYLTFFAHGQSTPLSEKTTFLGVISDLKPAPERFNAGFRRRLLDLAAVRLVLVPPLLRLRLDVREFFATADLGAPTSLGPFLAYPNPHALPRAFVTYRTRPAPAVEERLAAIADPAFDPLAASYVEGSTGFTEDPGAPSRGAPATIVVDDERVVEVDASLEADGLVVLADTYYPGWRASVDGAPARIVATNHLFRGVPVPAGRHRVRFEYRPWQVPVGIAVSGLALLVVLLLCRPGRFATDRAR
jgi:hypothetical protein